MTPRQERIDQALISWNKFSKRFSSLPPMEIAKTICESWDIEIHELADKVLAQQENTNVD